MQDPIVPAEEPEPIQNVTGFAAAMLDGIVKQFEYRGMVVYSPDEGKTVFVANQEGEALGEMLCKGHPIAGLVDWIIAKTQFYGDDS